MFMCAALRTMCVWVSNSKFLITHHSNLYLLSACPCSSYIPGYKMVMTSQTSGHYVGLHPLGPR